MSAHSLAAVSRFIYSFTPIAEIQKTRLGVEYVLWVDFANPSKSSAVVCSSKDCMSVALAHCLVSLPGIGWRAVPNDETPSS